MTTQSERHAHSDVTWNWTVAAALLPLFSATFGCGSNWDTPTGPAPTTNADAGRDAAPPNEDAGADAGGEDPLPATYPTGLHAVGNHIEDSQGSTIVLHGVNRSGTEYRCIQNGGFFDGDSNDASVRAMTTWKINAVRVPLNESCWLAISGAPSTYSGDNYKNAIKSYVAILHKYALVPILDLHWSAPGDFPADRLQPMPNADHAPAFWSDVAAFFLDDTGVVFEPYNEPFPGSSSTTLNQDTDAAWQCWRDGCVARQQVPTGSPAATYQAAGLQSLVDAIRDAGATHLVILGGVQYSNGLSQWLTYKPKDKLEPENLGAVWHVYNNNPCHDITCWNGAPAAVAAQVPIVATEIGQNDCQGAFIAPLMQFLDSHQLGYLAWAWTINNNGSPCVAAAARQAGQPWALITSYATAAPNGGYAAAFHDHLLSLVP